MDGAPPPEEDFSQIPIPERSQHKNWKARLSAYNDVIAKAAKTASDTDPFFRPFVSDGSLLKTWCTDANAVAQEKGIEAVLAIVQYSGESSARTRSDVVPSLVEKSLGASRAGTKRKGMDLCGMYVEVENTGDGVIGDILPGLDAKQPKVVAGCVACLKELVESFGGPSVGNIKPILKSLSKIFGHTDKTVREEATALAVALYLFLGPALQPSLADLKPVQLTELQKSFDSLDAAGKGAGTGRPTRFTRKVQRDRDAADASGGGGDANEQNEAEAVSVDPKSFLDPVNVLSLFPSDLDERLSSSKWKDRVEVLEECNKVLAQPANARISESNVDSYGSLVTTLGSKCKSDANINVVIEAAKLIEGLANGIGKPFGRFRGSAMPNMFERLKERKQNVVDALGKALDAMFATVPISDMIDDVLVALKSKNPQVRENALKFLHRSLSTTTTAPSKDQIQPIAQNLVTLLGDSTEPVRASAADCLGTMMKIVGERAFNPYIENVQELQLTKVKDAFAKAEIKYKAAGAAKAPAARPAAGGPKPSVVKKAPAPAPAPAPAASSELLDDFAPPARAPPARFARPAQPKSDSTTAAAAPPSSPPKAAPARPVPAKRPAPVTANAKAAPAAKAGPSKTLAISPSEPVKFKMSPEDAAARAADDIPSNFHTQLADPAWKVRLEAAEEMIKWAEEGGAEKVDSEVLMRFLAKTPGWGEKNFQVSAKIYQIMCVMAEKSPSFGRPAIALSVGHLSEKLGDMKLKKPAGDALTIYAEKTSLAFVLAQAYEPMLKQKAPKAQADALTWIKQQLTEFGIAGIPLRDLISFVKKGLQNPNAMVRSSATQVLVTIRVFVGADISGFLEDLNPQLLSTINGEFDKVAGQTPPEPTRTSADLQDATGGGKGGGKSGGADPLDDLIPRVDLDKLVSQTSVVADSKSEAWKVRKDAFEALHALLEVKSNGRLKPNMGEIAPVLKRAMVDTNLSVKMLALGIISKIAIGMGPAFEKHARFLVAPVAGVCADNKATTRAAGVATLNAMADGCDSLNPMYAGLATALETNNPSLRASVLSWMGERLAASPPDKGADLAPLAAPSIACLEDRTADVRKAAGLVLPHVVANAGYDFVMDQTTNLKPASKSTIVPLINNARSAGGPSTSASAASSKTPAPASPVSKVKAPARPNGFGSPKPAPGRSIAAPSRPAGLKPTGLAARPATATTEDRATGIARPRTLARPTPLAQPAELAPPAMGDSDRALPFVSASMDSRAHRLKKDTVRWILEASPKPDLAEYLALQMEQVVSPDLFTALFSKDHRAEEDFMAGLAVFADFYSDAAASTFGLSDEEAAVMQLANVDLVLKYAALKLLANNTQLGVRCLEVISNVIDTLARHNERFSDTEAKLWVPALIIKLGDSKFGAKLAPIFEHLDKVIASSQVVQLLVVYGIDDKSAGKTCKNESLTLIERTYRKRGSILRTRDDRGFYESVARCISDGGTRNAALSLMALLQLQGGSASLQAVIDAMPQSSKDMLDNRKNTMASTKPVLAVSALPRSMAAATDSPARKRSLMQPSAGLAKTPRAVMPQGESSPISRGIPRAVASPAGRESPSAIRSDPRVSQAPRTGATGPLRIHGESDIFGAGPSRPAVHAPSRSIATAPLPTRHLADSGDTVISAINDIRNEDPDRSVDALKVIQSMLGSQPDIFMDNIQSLVDALLDELDRAFTPLQNLHDSHFFRLVKHILQTFNAFSTNQELVRRLNYDDVYSILSTLTLHMVQADPMGGNIQELTRFINMLLIQLLAAPERKVVFKAMFTLLLDLTRDFGVNRTPPEAEAAAHADLVIKCLWKRCKILDDDLKNGRMAAGTLLGILEEFMQAIPPAEYRRRGMEGVALGEMPLRTVKAVIQKIVFYAKESGQEIYDILLIQFGDRASDTMIYPYVFRLAGLEANRPTANAGAQNGSRPASVVGQGRVVSGSSGSEPGSSSPTKFDSEAERLVRNIHVGQQEKRIDELYQFIQAAPGNEAEVQAAMTSLLSLPVATFIRRALASRGVGDEAQSPSHSDKSSSKSPPTRPDSHHSRAAKSGMTNGARPTSLNVDKGASTEDQLAQYKNFFNRAPGVAGSLSGSLNSRRHNPSGLENDGERLERTGVPLNEIAPPQQRMI